MRLIKKLQKGGLAFLLVGCFCFFPLSVNGTESAISEENQTILEEQMEISGANDLFEEIPEEAEEFLRDNGIDSANPDKLIDLSVGVFFESLWNTVKSKLTLPVRILFTTLAIVLLCSLFQTFRTTIEDKGYTQVFTVVSVLSVCATVLLPTSECITRAANAMRECGNFILSFIPVFTSIVAASGKPIAAAGYTTVMFGVVQIVSQIATAVLVPLLGIFLALSVAGSLNSQIHIAGILSTVKKVVIWVLGFSMTVLIGLLTIKGLVAGSADTVGTKTVKFLLGSFVPVVGGALSEALNSVQGCMGVIRSTVGSLGVVVVFFAFVPVLISVLLLMGSLHLSAGVAEVMSVEKVGEVLKSTASVLSLIFSIILMFAVLLILSVTIMLVVGMG